MATPSPFTDPDRLAQRNATGPTGGVADAKVAAAAAKVAPVVPPTDPDTANAALAVDGDITRFPTEHPDWTPATGANGQMLAVAILNPPPPEEP